MFSAARQRAVLAMACVIVIYPAYGEQGSPSMDPANPTYPVPVTTYESVLPGTTQAYLREADAKRLPWRKLFEPDGSFVPEEKLRGGSDAAVALSPTPAPTPPAAEVMAPGGSDMRAVIRSINAAQGKVKLKHGPIKRLGMPGMTMVFRVKDPAILEQVKEGEEVGVTVEVEGSRFFVTGFQK